MRMKRGGFRMIKRSGYTIEVISRSLKKEDDVYGAFWFTFFDGPHVEYFDSYEEARDKIVDNGHCRCDAE